jgi:transposase, IS5 family
MKEALHDFSLYCKFAYLDLGAMHLPDESTILRFRHLLEENNLSILLLATISATLAIKGLMLKTGTVVDATLIAVPSSTKNSSGQRDPEMYQTKKGNQWHFGMKAHIWVDADSGLVHTVIGTAANVNDVTQGHVLLHGQESEVFADACYLGAAKREEATGVDWQLAMRPGERCKHKHTPWVELAEKAEKLKASVRAMVEHPFRVIKCQFGFTKVRYKGLAKNTAQLMTLFALSNLWMARQQLMGAKV